MNKDLRIMELLSAYLDDELISSEKEEVEKLLATSLELRKRLEDLKKIKYLTNRVERIPESPFFETRLMATIEGQKNESSKFKRWLPAVSLAAITIVVMFVMKFNPGLFDQMWEDQKIAIAGFYKENLQPVLVAANLTNEDIFNFAFNNELPLDDTRKQYLLLGYDDSGKEFFEIRTSDQKVERGSYQEFMNAMSLDDNQKKSVDSIIGSYCEALEAQLLVNEKNTVAINPNLWNLRKAIFADLLVASEKLNKIKFDRFVPEGISQIEKDVVVNAVRQIKNTSGDKYIFVTPDSVFEDSYKFNPVIVEEKIKWAEKQIQKNEEKVKEFTINFKYDSTFKFFANAKSGHPFTVVVDSNICRVDIPDFTVSEILIPEIAAIDPLIEQATNNIHFYAYKIPKIEKSKSEIKIEYYNDDSVYSYVVNYNMINIDSLVQANSGTDLYNLEKFKQVRPTDDTMLIKYQFDRDYYNRYYSDDEFKREMEELQKELQQMSKELQNQKIKVHTKVTKSSRK